MIPELLSFSECCGHLPCRGGVDTIRFSIAFNSVCIGFYGFGKTGSCLPDRVFEATPEATASALFDSLFAQGRNRNIQQVGATVTWMVTVESLMEAEGMTELEALSYLSSSCEQGWEKCVFFGEIDCDPDNITFEYECSCQEAQTDETPACCDDDCYQRYETGLEGSIGNIAKAITLELIDYAAIPLDFPSIVGFPTSAFPGITDYGQDCYDFVCDVQEAPMPGLLKRFRMLWTPKRANACLHTWAAEVSIVACSDESNGYRVEGIVFQYILAGISVLPFPFLTAYALDCTLATIPTGDWVVVYSNFGAAVIHAPDYIFPCTLGTPVPPTPICAPAQKWCLPAMPGDRISFVIEESVKYLAPGTYSVRLSVGGNTACQDANTVRIGKIFVTLNPVTGQNVGFLESILPLETPPGCAFLVISSEDAEDFPAIEVPAGPNLLTVGSNGTFDTSAWNTGINAHTGVTIAQYGVTYNSAFFSLRAFNGSNTDSQVFATEPIAALPPNQSYILEMMIYGKAWPTDPLKALAITLPGLTGTETFSLLSAQPSNGSPLNEWMALRYQIDTGFGPMGFAINLLWDGPAFGAFPDYDILVDDMSLRLAPYTIAPTPPSPGVNLCSECIQVLRDDCFTGQVRYTNNGNGLGYPYSLGPVNYRQQFRLGWMKKEVQFGSDRSLYTNSQGRTVTTNSRMRLERDFEVQYSPEHVHQILALALEHDEFFVNMAEAPNPGWEAYVNEKDYKVTAFEMFPKHNLRKATVTLRLKEYNKANAYC